MEALNTALAKGVSDMATDLLGAITTNAPVLLPVFGALIAIGIILKVVRRVVGR